MHIVFVMYSIPCFPFDASYSRIRSISRSIYRSRHISQHARDSLRLGLDPHNAALAGG